MDNNSLLFCLIVPKVIDCLNIYFKRNVIDINKCNKEIKEDADLDCAGCRFRLKKKGKINRGDLLIRIRSLICKDENTHTTVEMKILNP